MIEQQQQKFWRRPLPRVSWEGDGRAVSDGKVTYTVLPNGPTTICQIELFNERFSVEVQSACVSKVNFNQEMGESFALKEATQEVGRHSARCWPGSCRCSMRPARPPGYILFLGSEAQPVKTYVGTKVVRAAPMILDEFHRSRASTTTVSVLWTSSAAVRPTSKALPAASPSHPRAYYSRRPTRSAPSRDKTTYLGTADGRSRGLATGRTPEEVAPIPHDARVRSPGRSGAGGTAGRVLGCLDLQKHIRQGEKGPTSLTRSDFHMFLFSTGLLCSAVLCRLNVVLFPLVLFLLGKGSHSMMLTTE
jgi:Phage protein (N4 Gp49/phage Sf6 gene 66) family